MNKLTKITLAAATLISLFVAGAFGSIAYADRTSTGSSSSGPANSLQASNGSGGFIATGTPQLTAGFYLATSTTATSTLNNISVTTINNVATTGISVAAGPSAGIFGQGATATIVGGLTTGIITVHSASSATGASNADGAVIATTTLNAAPIYCVAQAANNAAADMVEGPSLLASWFVSTTTSGFLLRIANSGNASNLTTAPSTNFQWIYQCYY